MLKKFSLLSFLLLTIFSLAACADDVWSGDDVIILTRLAAETTQPVESSALPETTALPDSSSDMASTVTETSETKTKIVPELVYWVDGGSVWHLRSDCSSLRRSENVRSGTEEEALFAGKSRVCKHCGRVDTADGG